MSCRGVFYVSAVVGRDILDAPNVQFSNYGQFIYDAIVFLSENTPGVIVHNFVIMPNHVHILLSLGPVKTNQSGASGMSRPTEEKIPRLISSLKRYTNRKAGFDMWQTGYYDHIIRDDEDFIRRWRYIDNNPSAWLDDDYFVNS